LGGKVSLFRRLSVQDWSIVDEWLERLGLASLAGQGYGEISGGEQRKALIARAMVQQPAVLLLDEPTANLDLGWRERIVRVIEDLHESTKVTIMLVCHELEVLPRCCRRVAVLRQGSLIADGAPEDTLTDQLLESLYGPGLSVLPIDHRYAVVPGAVTYA
jgi:iron complex transport system ATP-binding protein